MEQGRVIGLIIKSLWDNRRAGSLVASLAILFTGTLFITASVHSSVAVSTGLNVNFVLAVPTLAVSLAVLLHLLNRRKVRT